MDVRNLGCVLVIIGRHRQSSVFRRTDFKVAGGGGHNPGMFDLLFLQTKDISYLKIDNFSEPLTFLGGGGGDMSPRLWRP